VRVEAAASKCHQRCHDKSVLFDFNKFQSILTFAIGLTYAPKNAQPIKGPWLLGEGMT
jgi:hypothetical protein